MSLGSDNIVIGFCGEINSGKSTALQSVLRQACLPDFFGLNERPVVTVALGAENESIIVRYKDGRDDTVASAADILASEDIASVSIALTDNYGLGPCTLVEIPALRDGHLTEEQLVLISACSVFVWTTIGSQAWRLSEKNILDQIGERMPRHKILVTTRADKFRSEADSEKLEKRLQREAGAYFGVGCLLGVPSKMLQTPEDGDWHAAGAIGFASIVAKFVNAERHASDMDEQDETVSSDRSVRAIQRSRRRVESLRRRGRLAQTRPVEQAEEASVVEAIAPKVEIEAEASEDKTLEDVVEAIAASDEVAEVEAIEETPEAPAEPVDPIAEFLETLHGIVAFGSAEIENPNNVEHLFGDEGKMREFAIFSAMSAKALLTIAGFGGTDPHPESEQIAMKTHTVIYRIDEGRALFLVGESATFSTGIAKTAFARVARLYDANKVAVAA